MVLRAFVKNKSPLAVLLLMLDMHSPSRTWIGCKLLSFFLVPIISYSFADAAKKVKLEAKVNQVNVAQSMEAVVAKVLLRHIKKKKKKEKKEKNKL